MDSRALLILKQIVRLLEQIRDRLPESPPIDDGLLKGLIPKGGKKP